MMNHVINALKYAGKLMLLGLVTMTAVTFGQSVVSMSDSLAKDSPTKEETPEEETIAA